MFFAFRYRFLSGVRFARPAALRGLPRGSFWPWRLGMPSACTDAPGTRACSFDERLAGEVLYVELICEEAWLEGVFVAHLAERYRDDLERRGAFEEYRFRLSLIPEDSPDDSAISVLFSYIFFDAAGDATSRVEAFEFLVPRVRAARIEAEVEPERRFALYEALREEQPDLNPRFCAPEAAARSHAAGFTPSRFRPPIRPEWNRSRCSAHAPLPRNARGIAASGK